MQETLTISQELAHLRLDKLLTTQFPAYSRTYFQNLIQDGCVLVNGLPSKKREQPHEGDEIEICFQITPELSLEPQNIPLDILYEDDHLLAVNKPPGMVVHPAPGHPSQTFANALLYHCKTLPASDSLRPGIVHRLDKETSGVLIAAKSYEAHHKLIALFAERKIEKRYRAICLGNPGDVTISAPIKRHPTKRQEMAVVPGGKEAISRVRVLATNGTLSYIEIYLLTGRTHQIRVHLKHHQTPILGDRVYGSSQANQKWKALRPLLHAYEMELLHPISQKLLHFQAPLPSDIAEYSSFPVSL
jgi:23S rRNA pseudouridine1911/1915/1917 synthase